MSFISQILGIPLGWIMYAFYYITEHYVLSLFLFTLVTRLIMLPFTFKQQKTTAKMNLIKPQMDELQKKYANNREKLNEEMMKLYQQEGYNPMSGCLPLLVQFPILFGLIDVIYKPLTHILRISSEAIDAGIALIASDSAQARLQQLDLLKQVNAAPDKFMPVMGADAVEAIQGLNMNFLSIDLSQTPSWGMLGELFTKFTFHPIILIPLFAGVCSFLMSKQSMQNTAMDGAGGASMKGMMYTMPLMSLFICFQVPAGVGIYWGFSSLIALIQGILMNKLYNPKDMAERARIEAEERREKERLERIEAKKKDPNRNLSQKEINRRKLAEARKRDAEKYGETYDEVTDADLQ